MSAPILRAYCPCGHSWRPRNGKLPKKCPKCKQKGGGGFRVRVPANTLQPENVVCKVRCECGHQWKPRMGTLPKRCPCCGRGREGWHGDTTKALSLLDCPEMAATGTPKTAA